MDPLFVTLSIFIKGLPLVYPGRGLMVGGGGGVMAVVVGDHAVTFTVLKKAYCRPLPKVLLLKTFWELLGPRCSLQIRAAGTGPYLQSIPTLRVMEELEWFGWGSFNSFHAILEAVWAVYWALLSNCFLSPLPAPPWSARQFDAVFSQTSWGRDVNMEQRRVWPFAPLCDWWPLLTNPATTVTGSLTLTGNLHRLRPCGSAQYCS